MPLASSLRPLVPLLIGLIVGGAGVMMFLDSTPGEPGSPEERSAKLEVALKKAQNQITELQALGPGQSRFDRDPRRTFSDGARSIMQRIRDGQHVSPEEIFRATKPIMRDLAPLFDRIRVREQQRRIDSLSGEIARRYDLTPEQQKGLKVWFDAKATEQAQRWSEMLGREETGLEDMMRASRDVRPDDGLDKFMEGVLSGEKLAEFKTERMNERVERVERDADMKMQRLDGIVGLSDQQRDQVFNHLARNSRDYDPAMGLGEPIKQDSTARAASARETMLRILTPDQRAAYDAERRRRFEEAQKDMNAVGLTLPPNWEMLDDDGFR